MKSKSDGMRFCTTPIADQNPSDLSMMCKISVQELAALKQDKNLVDHLEKMVFHGREAENELHFDFTAPTLREAFAMLQKSKS